MTNKEVEKEALALKEKIKDLYLKNIEVDALEIEEREISSKLSILSFMYRVNELLRLLEKAEKDSLNRE